MMWKPKVDLMSSKSYIDIKYYLYKNKSLGKFKINVVETGLILKNWPARKFFQKWQYWVLQPIGGYLKSTATTDGLVYKLNVVHTIFYILPSTYIKN